MIVRQRNMKSVLDGIDTDAMDGPDPDAMDGPDPDAMDGPDPDAMVGIGVNICRGRTMVSRVPGVMDDVGVAAAAALMTLNMDLRQANLQTAPLFQAAPLPPPCLGGRGGVDGLGWLGGVDGLGEAGGGVHGPLYTSMYL
jgi:hypothetical protein